MLKLNFELSHELESLISSTTKILSQGAEFEAAIAANKERQNNLTLNFECARSDLEAADTELALCIDPKELTKKKKAVAEAQAVLKENQNSLDDLKRMESALRTNLASLEVKIIASKQEFDQALRVAASDLYKSLENRLRDALEPAFEILQAGTVLAKYFEHRNFNDAIRGSTILSPIDGATPILGFGRVNVDGGMKSLIELAVSGNFNHIDTTFSPLRATRNSLLNYKPFAERERMAKAYVPRGHTVEEIAKPSTPKPPSAPKSKSPPVEQPQEINLAPELVRLGEQQFDIDEALQR